MAKKIDMTGWVMREHGVPESKITVIERDYEIKNNVSWKCLCDCGTIFSAQGTNLRTGNTKSCGCTRQNKLLKRNTENKIIPLGEKFEKLTVIEFLGYKKQKSRNNKESWYKCQCDCGTILEVRGSCLKAKHTKSCGCISSYGESVIKDILDRNKIIYKTQYSFSELVGEKKPLRFDFAIFEEELLKYLIEFDGRQHFTGPEAKWKEASSLEQIQYYDNLKNEYCIKNNYPLIRIPYYHLGKLNINDLKLETSNFIIEAGKEKYGWLV